jgi:hypothetical protein
MMTARIIMKGESEYTGEDALKEPFLLFCEWGEGGTENHYIKLNKRGFNQDKSMLNGGYHGGDYEERVQSSVSYGNVVSEDHTASISRLLLLTHRPCRWRRYVWALSERHGVTTQNTARFRTNRHSTADFNGSRIFNMGLNNARLVYTGERTVVFWVMAPCCAEDGYQRSVWNCCLHVTSRTLMTGNKERKTEDHNLEHKPLFRCKKLFHSHREF